MKRSYPIAFFLVVSASVFLSIARAEQSDQTTASSKTISSTTSQNKDQSTSSQDKSTNSSTSSKVAKKSASAGSSSGGGGSATANVQAASVHVEPFTGSANLGVPIAVPQGRAGIQPSLAVAYSSSSHQLGLAGVGWDLGMGFIQRSTKKGVPTYDDNKDAFVLVEGSAQDLVYDPQTGFYRSEIEAGFAKIEKKSDRWLITDKKGTQYTFGLNASARQADPQNTAHIFRWYLEKVQDINGNFMSFTYNNNGNGYVYPVSIDYTGNSLSGAPAYAQVEFVYQAATIPQTLYTSGFKVVADQILKQVGMKVNGNLQGRYLLTYGLGVTQRDLLQQIRQYGYDNTALPPIKFTYTAAENIGFQQAQGWNIPSPINFSKQINGRWLDLGIRVADLNADGYPDFVHWYYDACPSDESATGLIKETFIHDKNKSWVKDSRWTPTESWAGFIKNCGNYDGDTGLRLADINGDGLEDVLRHFRYSDSSGSIYLNALINNQSNGFTNAATWYMPSDTEFAANKSGATEPSGTMIADINGDGFADIIRSTRKSKNVHTAYLNNKINNADNWTAVSAWNPPDADQTDLANGAMMVDLNGDGLADIFYLKAGAATVYINNGHGWELNNAGFGNTLGLGDFTDGSTQMADFNGDGFPDLIIAASSKTPRVLLNTGNGWINDDRWALSTQAHFNELNTQFLDANADGMTDYMIAFSGNAQQLYLNQGKPADVLVMVDNGIGAKTIITYDSSAHYTNRFLPFVIQVVKSVTVTDAVTQSSYTTRYEYSDGYWDVNYREFAGFGMVKAIDPQGNYAVTHYDQRHFYKGRPIDQSSFDAQGNLYGKSINTWDEQTIVDDPKTPAKFIFLKRSDSFIYDGNSTGKRTA